jgi:hypothetical protein
MTDREGPRRKLDRFDHDLLVFVLSWAPYGAPPGDECFVEFGMSPDRVHERCMQVVCTARPDDFHDAERSLLLRASRLLLERPLWPAPHPTARVQRDKRSIAPVAIPNVKRFARRAASAITLRPALAGRSATSSPTRTIPPESTPQ